MKKFLVSVIIFLSFAEIKPQNFKIGGSFNFMLGNKNLAYELGPAINIEYLFDDLPISINGCARFRLSALNNDTYQFSWSNDYTIYSLGTIIKYYPYKWDIEPYIAYGLFYNSFNSNSSGHPTFINGFIISPKIDKNNLSSEITAGLILTAKTPVNIVFEVTQSFNKLDYDLIMLDSDYNKKTLKEEFNFNALFIKLGVRFSL